MRGLCLCPVGVEEFHVGGSGQMDEEVAVLDRVKKSEVEKIFSDTQVTDRRNIKSKEYQNVSSMVLSS